MPPAAAAIGVGIMAAGAIGQAVAGQELASAQGAAARAQLTEQQRQQAMEIKMAQESRDLALQYAKMTPQELAEIDRNSKLISSDIARKEKILASVDPALIEAGTQALQLLRGEEAKTLAPIRDERARQRKSLEDRLRSQLGSGFESSTAGLQALNEFDRQTSQVMAGAQEQSLQTLLGATQNIANISALTPDIYASQSLATLMGANRQLSVNAILGTQVKPTAITEAGAPFATAAAQAANSSRMWGNVGNIGGALLGASAGGAFGGGAAATTATPYAGSFTSGDYSGMA